MNRLIAVLALALALPLSAAAQGIPPGRRELKTVAPEYQGTKARGAVPDKFHTQNEGGSDGAGLCVIASLIQNGQTQGVPVTRGGKQSPLWRAAKAAPGGYDERKLQNLLKRLAPNEEYASYVGTNFKVIEKLNERGIPVAGTMSTGELYNWAPIHHFVSWEHFDTKKNIAAFMDNNDRPLGGKAVHRWMTATEAQRRLLDGGSYWAFAWVRRAAASPKVRRAAGYSALLCLAGALLIVRKKRHEAEAELARLFVSQ